MQPYYTNTLYVDFGFSGLKSLIRDYLSHIRFYGGDSSEDNLRTHPAELSESTHHQTKIRTAAQIVYPTKEYTSFIGSGILIRLCHYRRALQDRIVTDEVVPTEIKKNLENFPNAVEIETHRKFPADGFNFAKELAVWLSARKCQTLMFTCDFEVFAIKSSPLLNEVEKFEKLSAYTARFDDPSRFTEAKKQLTRLLASNWRELHASTAEFLTTSVHIYNCYDTGSAPVCLDTSPIAIGLSKALENEIKHKILLPYRAYFQSMYSSSVIARELRGGDLRFMANYLTTTGTEGLELGKFAYFLKAIITKPNLAGSVITGTFKDFVDTRKQPGFFLDLSEFHSNLELVTKRYRNKIAHADPVPFADTSTFLRILVGEAGLDNGFLSRIVKASKGASS